VSLMQEVVGAVGNDFDHIMVYECS
jgi:hypothetical protein